MPSVTTMVTLVNTAEGLQDACEALKGKSPIVIDLEGSNLGRRGSVTMLQVAGSPEQVYCFDVMQMGDFAFQMLKPLLEDISIVKLCYDCRCDADALLHLHGIYLRGVYDLQILFTLLFQASSDPYLKGLYHALQMPHIIEHEIRDEVLSRKRECKRMMQTASGRLLFAQRPVPPYILEYCALDVVFLFNMYNQWRHYRDEARLMRMSERRMQDYCFTRLPSDPRIMSCVDFVRIECDISVFG